MLPDLGQILLFVLCLQTGFNAEFCSMQIEPLLLYAIENKRFKRKRHAQKTAGNISPTSLPWNTFHPKTFPTYYISWSIQYAASHMTDYTHIRKQTFRTFILTYPWGGGKITLACIHVQYILFYICLLYTSPSPRD